MFALCDGVDAVALAPARDYKRAYDGDGGPNTGGMGSFAPVAEIDDDALARIVDETVRPVLAELASRGSPFVGDAVRRPHADARRAARARVQLPVRRSGDAVGAAPRRRRPPRARSPPRRTGRSPASPSGGRGARRSPSSLAAGDYPASADRGTPIEGIEEAEASGALVFHAGTALSDGRLVTNGGRLLGVTATGPTLGEARARAYAAADLIRIPGARRREDIALAAAGERVTELRNERRLPRGTPSHHPLSILLPKMATSVPLSASPLCQLVRTARRPATTGTASRIGVVIPRYSRPAMTRIWSDEARLARMLDVELAALSRAGLRSA